MMKRIAISAVIAASVLSLAACNISEDSKYGTGNNDVPTVNGNRNAAEIGWMPDGYSNYGTKCDRPGIRIYVTFHGDSPYGNVFPIADDTCK